MLERSHCGPTKPNKQNNSKRHSFCFKSPENDNHVHNKRYRYMLRIFYSVEKLHGNIAANQKQNRASMGGSLINIDFEWLPVRVLWKWMQAGHMQATVNSQERPKCVFFHNYRMRSFQIWLNLKIYNFSLLIYEWEKSASR